MPTTNEFVEKLSRVLRLVHTADLREIEVRLNRNRWGWQIQWDDKGMYTAHDLAEMLLRIVQGEKEGPL